MQENTTSHHGLPLADEQPHTLLSPLSDPIKLFLLVPIATVFLWYAVAYFTSPLRKYPGPFLGAWTNYYRMWYAYQGNIHLVTKKLHDKYGPVVRMAPNYIDVDYASLIKACFDVQGVWEKTEWHAVSGAPYNGSVLYNIFSEVRAKEHTRIKKPIAKYFSQAGVAPLEPHVSVVGAMLMKQLADRFGDGQEFDFGPWMSYFAWDAVAKVTWSTPVGFLEKGADFNGSLATLDKAMDYLVIIGMNHKLDKFFDKNPIMCIGPPSFAEVTNLGLGHLLARIKAEDKHDPAKPDFLDGYLEAHQKDPETVDIPRMMTYMLVNIAAGADTTACALRSLIWLPLKHPRVYAKLEAEILAAEFTELPITFAEARRLPYLDAVVWEYLRYLPGNCFPMERRVPKGGVGLPDGTHVPEGTAIGFKAYVMNRNKEVWGEDAEEFNPDRWLRGDEEREEAYKERMQRLNNVDLSFSVGSRKCIGMNIAKMKVYKILPMLVRMFKWELADPEREWKIHNSLFPRQSGLMLKIRKRDDTDALIANMDMSY